MDKVWKVHFCNFRGRMRDAQRLLVLGAAAVFSAVCAGLAIVADALNAGGGVITVLAAFGQMYGHESQSKTLIEYFWEPR